MAELHQTGMGQKLIEHTLPNIGDQLKRIADVLENKAKGETIQVNMSAIDELVRSKDLMIAQLTSFIEYEEGYTTDKNTRKRIEDLLKKLKIWS